MEGSKKIKIGVILGPTASGKTAASICAAKALGAEIISADSIQVYRELDIGSAKPTLTEMGAIPHHLLSVVEPSRADFSAGLFQRLAASCIADIHGRGRLPLVVGGTGLYINALTYPLAFEAVPGNPAIREKLIMEEAQCPGSGYRQLQTVDPDSATRLHPNDKKRVLRALEVYLASGRTMTSYGVDFSNNAKAEAPYEAVTVGLTMERERLYQRIEERVDLMMQSGLLEEVRGLYEKGYAATLPAMQGLGYRQLYRYFNKERTLEEAVADIKLETRHFAKRQTTWFRRDKRITWLDVEKYAGAEALGAAIAAIIGGEAYGER